MLIQRDLKYMHVKYYTTSFICIAALPYSEALGSSFFDSNIGRHIKQYLTSYDNYINVVYIYKEAEDNSQDRILEVVNIVHKYGKEWIFEDILEFRICPNCKEVCKLGIPMGNISEISNVFGWECITCMGVI